jgi:hypothetical protein
MTDRRIRNPPMASLLKLAAEQGTATERRFVLHLRLILLPPFVLIILTGEAAVHLGWSFYDVGAVLVGYLALGFYQQAFLRPIYSPSALRSLAQKGWGTSSPRYYSELANYMENNGVDGRLPWVTSWGWAAVGLFYSFLLFGIVLVQIFSVSLGIWSLAVFACLLLPSSYCFWRAYRQRIRRSDKEAEACGYPLKTASSPRKSL